MRMAHDPFLVSAELMANMTNLSNNLEAEYENIKKNQNLTVEQLYERIALK